jgi:mannan endo-1,4-beta-mannosidase
VPGRRGGLRLAATITALVVAVAAVTFAVYHVWHPGRNSPRQSNTLAAAPASYLGLYAHGVPGSYAEVQAFTTATKVRPRILVYYSGWLEPFNAGFARTAAGNGAVPLVQINPTDISISDIAHGRYDDYLRTFAAAVRTYRRPVILSFGHEMNGNWYSWSYTHTSPAVFVAAWRHIVTLFRAQGAANVTWLWTVNTTTQGQPGVSSAGGPPKVPTPKPWWPGSSYVDWVGIDGYYTSPSEVFASIFGPTITDVRSLTSKPIIISETSATSTAGQANKIAGLFDGVRLYGLLGFIWFNSVHDLDWRLRGAEAIAALRRGAAAYPGATS